ncbi:hypothetical protein CO116_00420 [Candidatus Falkowbacteria bacterium CG_4_9_14_3_um_filter_38_19]|uniref:Uncharacterized protein n=1 Tax=Candidatus Falkowbacteria bacterium CG_4_9_14_3_um_filter_38_19 TaxID=1974559 RepID=A0A2M8AJU3_9BACT|nr:MAG: hypothetical protein CO116_00420 [Candidatus Falkowbacteria bacterium CG_4_9_14_3_um_filter_38_19]
MALLILAFILLILPLGAKAVCPICTVAVCGSVGLSQWLGIDDTITGLWLGGLAVSLIAWTIDWLNKKNLRFLGRKPLIVLIYYAAIIWPLYQFNLASHPYNKLWGFDKLFLGIFVGSIAFLIGALSYKYLKKKNNGRAYFPFQKIIIPISLLILLSFIFYFICDIIN